MKNHPTIRKGHACRLHVNQRPLKTQGNLGIVEDEVPAELSRDPVGLRIHVPGDPTKEENARIIDLGMHRYIYEETLWENDGKPGKMTENLIPVVAVKSPRY
ncbi:hypothetical protein LIER_39528 [Lithospermum erythrorhizon]|uniref:Uncharacterized protein n=1 Tax=Lithospermum erythrorhizon TaxID=34254 RepID=A0AAV3QGB8_LITER